MARYVLLTGLVLAWVPLAAGAPNLVGEVTYQIGTQANDAGQVPVEFEVWVENVGDSSCPLGWWVDFWATYPCPCTEPPGSCAASPITIWSSTDFGNLAPGQKLKLSPKVPTFWVTPGPNPLTYFLFVDSVFDVCAEADEEDNFVCDHYTVSATMFEPDLTVGECVVENSNEDPADVWLSVLVTNTGETETQDSAFVEFLFNDACTPEIPYGVDGDAFAEIPAGLGPGEQYLAKTVVADLPAGNYSMAAVVNGLQLVEEADWENNCCLLDPNPFVQQELSDKPDLQISSFEVKLAGNNTVYYEGVVGNYGFVDVEPEQEHKICIWFDRADEPPICAIPDVSEGEGDIINIPMVVEKGDCFEDVDCPACYACNPETGLCTWDGVRLDCEYDFGATIGFLPNGCYSVWARVDCDCVGGATGEIWETKEKNNDAKSDLCVDLPGPDLKVQMFMVSEDTESDYSKVKYFVQVSNEGTDPVDWFPLDIFFNAPVLPEFGEFAEFPACGDGGTCDMGWYAEGEGADCTCRPDGIYLQFDDTLGPGEKVSIPVPPAVLEWDPVGGIPQGEYRAWAVVDIYNEIPETNESNNYLFKDIDVVGVQPGTPNLTVSLFSSYVEGNIADYDIIIKNNGDKDIPASKPFRIDLFIDRDTPPDFMEFGDYFTEVGTGLKAGDTKTWEKTVEGMDDGEYHSYVMVDSANVIEEANEGDNKAGPRIVVVCSQCNQCPEDKYITKTCVCGVETVTGGYCCDGEWYAVGCPVNPDAAEDITAPDNSAVVEWFPPGNGNKPGDCACSLDGPVPLSWAPLCVLLLLAGLWVLLRRVQES